MLRNALQGFDPRGNAASIGTRVTLRRASQGHVPSDVFGCLAGGAGGLAPPVDEGTRKQTR